MLYRHKKRGTVYRILQHATLQWDGPADMASVVVYQDVAEPNRIWVRAHDEFFDGRFEEFDPSEDEGEDRDAVTYRLYGLREEDLP